MRIIDWFIIVALSLPVVSASYYSFDISSNRLGYYPFNDTGVDYGSQGIDLTVGENMSFASCIYGNCAAGSNRVGSYLWTATDRDFTKNGGTVSLWLRINETPATTNRGVLNANYYELIFPTASTQLRFRAYDSAFKTLFFKPSLSLNTWYFLTLQVATNSLKIYLDGTLVNSSSTFTLTSHPYDWGVLNGYAAPTTDRALSGKAAELNIWNSTLTTQQIKEVYSCRTPNSGWGTWTMLANCTVTGESDVTDASFKGTDDNYILDNSNLTVGGFRLQKGTFKVTNGGKFAVA